MINRKNRKKYKTYLRDELEAASIYNIVAKSYAEPEKASIFIKLAESEMRHASHWANLIGIDSSKLNYNKNTVRTMYVKLICNLFGPDKILPWLSRIESAGVKIYDKDPEAKFLSKEERNHAKTILQMASPISSKSHHENESTHKSVTHGNVRAAVLGINDGLISNFCLIMGFAGGATATGNPEFILLAGFAGLLAGSFVVETIFQIPGLGRFYVEAAFNRDYTMILGTTIFFSAMIVFFNLLSDLAAMWLNPRSRDTS